MTNGQDGGRWALAGFVYQVVGMLSMVARASQPPEFSQANDAAEVDSLISLLGVGSEVQAHHEHFEDTAFTADDECVLVQFKYSSTGRKIGVAEAREITKKLDQSVKAAESQGHTVTACVLFTNRELTKKGGRAAKQHWEAKKQERSYALRYHRSPPIGKLITKLRGVGHEFGLFDDEIEDGIRKLIGNVFFQAGDLFDTPFGWSHFKEYLVGSANAQPLRAARISEYPHLGLEDLGGWIRINQWHSNLVSRGIFRDVIEAISDDHALIGLCGPGGCGKSTLMWQVLTNLPAGRCCAFVHAEELLSSWIGDTVHRWRGLLGSSEDTREKAINRLLIANPGTSRPVLWLGLDGVDEGNLSPEREGHLREVVRWFWRKDRNRANVSPPATLIVSSRREQKLYDLLWYGGDPPQSRLAPLTFRMEAFTEAERKMATRQELPQIYQTIYRSSTYDRSVQWSEITQVWGAEIQQHEVTSVDQAVWESLRHPAMWRALLRLDRDTRIRAIQGDRDAQGRLALGFIQWFGIKLRMRRGARAEDWTRNGFRGLIEILAAVARGSRVDAMNRRDQDWVRRARQTPMGISRSEAEDLYRESCSSGLIKEDRPRSWRWRHPLVYSYLVTCHEGDPQNE